jgi:hypothetical protein
LKELFMKTIWLIPTLLAAQLSFGATAAYTNVNGIVLGIVMATTNVVAGDRLRASMIVSNASDTPTDMVVWKQWGYQDTEIGNFVVTDESGYVLPRTVPYYDMGMMGHSGRPFPPGASGTFEGDVVWGCSVTNPGTYLVKAVARVPGSMVIETPPLAITVTPRGEASAPPPPLYSAGPPGETAEETARLTAQQVQGLAPLRVTHPKPERPPPVPRVAPREVVAAPLPVKVQEVGTAATATGAIADQGTTRSGNVSSRSILLGLMALLLGGGLVIYLVWSRRKHDHP